MALNRLRVFCGHISVAVAGILSPQRGSRVLISSRPLSSSTSGADSDIESHKVAVNSVQIHYEKAGKGAHSVLLLPGALGSTRTDFTPQLEKLNREKFTVYSYDPRGYGKSRPPDRDWPLNFYERDAEDAVALLKELGVSKVSILGWSDGGITALIIAARYQQLCQKLVVWGGNSYISDKDITMVSAVRNTDQWSERMRKPFIEMYGEEYFRTQWSAWVDAYVRIYEERKGDICSNELTNITCPTLIIHGQLDAMVSQEHPDYLHANIKQSKLINWPKAKHNLHLRYADDFNSTVEEFLSSS